ncbi:hypothetical protein [Kitasatospora cinereorecta]|uniref:Uncharacterized protein n=1 Tax=Kitasatospora cinereorecta TaxID=285560 RepID=A0ABW0VR66_9ACTN
MAGRPRHLKHGLADYVDRCVGDSFYDHPSQDAHRQYLAALPDSVRSHGLGYVASRNFAVEDACHDALEALPPAKGLLDTSTGRDLMARCEDVGADLVAMLRWLKTTGH